MAIHVACGSWADPEYVDVLFPKELPAKNRLSGYARWFDHVEVNSTFYAAPRKNVVETWIAQTPPAFTFNIKLHRAFSVGPKKAGEEGTLLNRYIENLQPLVARRQLAAFFLVLPPSFSPDRHRLEELDALAEKISPFPLAVELRHADWVRGCQRDKTLGYFREHKLAWISVDMPRIKGSALMPAVDAVTDSRCAYFRLHGRNPHYLTASSAAEGHAYAYTTRELKEISERVRAVADQADCVHVIANNHAQDFAPKTALTLQQMLGVKSATSEK